MRLEARRSSELTRLVCALVLTAGAAQAKAPAVTPATELKPSEALAEPRPDEAGALVPEHPEKAPAAINGADDGSLDGADELEPRPPRSSDGAPTVSPDEELGFGFALFQTVIVLCLVVAAIYLVLNVGLRRLMGIQGGGASASGVISIIERAQLDQRRALFVVRAANEYLLLGGSESSLSLITKLDAAEVERLKREPRSVTLSPMLQKLLGRGAPQERPPSKGP